MNNVFVPNNKYNSGIAIFLEYLDSYPSLITLSVIGTRSERKPTTKVYYNSVHARKRRRVNYMRAEKERVRNACITILRDDRHADDARSSCKLQLAAGGLALQLTAIDDN